MATGGNRVGCVQDYAVWYSPFAELTGEQLGLKPIMSLHSRLIAVKRIVKGDTVGYGAVAV